MGPAHQPFHPPAKRRVALRYIGQRGARSMDQLFAQILVAAFADSEQLRLAASGELTGNQAEPRGEFASTVEAFRSGRRPGLSSAAEPLRSPSPSGRTRPRTLRSVDQVPPIARERRRRARSSANSIPLRPAHPSARPGTARASTCPAARPFLAPAEWRATD